jgi:hypothetical protein
MYNKHYYIAAFMMGAMLIEINVSLYGYRGTVQNNGIELN